jgi:phosphocarrier protein
VETDPQRITKEVTIVNEYGFHARPIMQFVDLANRYTAQIQVSKGDQVVDGKSPMEIMLLEAICGTDLILSATGQDAQEAIAALSDLIARRFEED